MLTSKEPAERIDLNNIPADMAEIPAWAPWEAVLDKDRSQPGGTQVYKKIATRLNGKGYLKNNSTDGWGTLEQAKAAYDPKKHAGLMFMLKDNDAGAAVLDVDLVPGHDWREVAKASDEAKNLMVSSLIEKSPSGNGVHCWFRGTYPVDANGEHPVHKHAIANKQGEKIAEVEMYDATDSRYMTFTGQAATKNAPDRLKSGTKAAASLTRVFMSKTPKTAETAPQSLTGDVGVNPYHLTEDEIMAAINKDATTGSPKAKAQAQKILSILAAEPAALEFPNDEPGHQSSAEQSLMNGLAYYTGKDATLMDQIYRASSLSRDKWDRKDGRLKYGERTIENAINSTTKIYRPANAQSSSAVGASPQLTPPGPSPRELAARAYIEGLDMSKVTYAQIKSDARQFLTDEEKDRLLLNATGSNQVDAFLKSVDPKYSMEPASTGFKLLDDKLGGGLFPGLYVLGAISSLGKTTLLLQIADQIAASGQDVILFSLEMSSYEIIAKSLSRYTFEQALKDRNDGQTSAPQDDPLRAALTVRDISDGRRRNGFTDAYGHKHKAFTAYRKMLIEKAGQQYKDGAGGHLTILESVGTTSPDEIKAQVERHEQLTGQRPVVIVDYLQIIAPADPRSSDKQNTDAAVLALKQLSRDENIPVFTISSFNRANYSTGVSMIAFKESGAIEYSSDVLIGLEFSKQKEVDEANRHRKQNEAIHVLDTDAEKQREPRLVDAKILKNRNGETGGRVSFKYYARFNDYHEVEPDETNDLGQPHDFIVTDYSQLQKRAKKGGYI